MNFESIDLGLTWHFCTSTFVLSKREAGPKGVTVEEFGGICKTALTSISDWDTYAKVLQTTIT